MAILGHVDKVVNQSVAKQNVQLNLHLGGKHYLSVTFFTKNEIDVLLSAVCTE